MTEPVTSLPAVIANELARMLQPLAILSEPAELPGLVRQLGFDLPADVTFTSVFTDVAGKVEAVLKAVYELSDASNDDQQVRLTVALATEVRSLLQLIAEMGDRLKQELGSVAAFRDESGIEGELPRRLLDLLVARYVMAAQPFVWSVATLLGIAEWENLPADATRHRLAAVLPRIRLERIPQLIAAPGDVAEEVLGWRTGLKAEPVVATVGLLFDSLGFGIGNHEQDPLIQSALGRPAGATELVVPLLEGHVDAAGLAAEAGFRLSPIPAQGGRPPGLGVFPYILGTLDERAEALDGVTVDVRATAVLDGMAALRVHPPGDVELVWDVDSGAVGAGEARVAVQWRRPSDDPLRLFGTLGGSGLTLRGARAALVMRSALRDGEVTTDAAVEIEAIDLTATLSPGAGDGFLQQVLPPEGVSATVTVGLGVSTRTGVYLTGSGTLAVTVPVRVSLFGVLTLNSLYAAVEVADTGLSLDLAGTILVTIGPAVITVERMGLTASLDVRADRPPPGVKYGSAFRPPDGAGLVIKAGPVVGGGYLFFDRRNGQYAGALQLEFKGIALKAVGIITTQMPDGADGFSMLLIISAEFTPIQLGYGFTLNGVGGLIGVNRTVALEVLRNGIRTGSLNSIMFPKDPVANAPQLISDLSAIFPPAPGRFVIGPMARLGWGTPTLLTLDLGLVLELPPPVRLAVLGRLRMTLPEPKAAVVIINMDVLGVLDFERGEVSIDATLYDSRIAAFGLTGDMALRAGWGDRPGFALSIGGFHPRFQPPPNFPTLSRLALSLSTGDNPRLRLEAYLALTSNTVQFGARLELYASAAGFTVEGMLAFDALFQFDPFMVLLEIAGSVALKLGGRILMGVSVQLALSGPTPWHATGRARFEILLFSVEVSFDVTLGEATPPELPAPVELLPVVEAAFADSRNWTAQLPAQGESLVSLREIARSANVLFIHPLGSVAVSQRVAPLGQQLARLGNSRITDATRLDITSLRIGAAEPPTDPIDEYFAPAQFLDLTDDEKLARPSFERWEGGRRVRTVGSGRDTSPPIEASPVPMTTIIDAPDAVPRDVDVQPLSPVALRRASATSAAAYAPIRQSGPSRYAGPPLGLEVAG